MIYTQDENKKRDNAEEKEQQSRPKIGQKNNTTTRNKDKNYNKIRHRLQRHCIATSLQCNVTSQSDCSAGFPWSPGQFICFSKKALEYPSPLDMSLLIKSPYYINWKISCDFSSLLISIQIYSSHIISSVHAVKVLQNLLTVNFHYQFLNIFHALPRYQEVR